MKTRLLLIWFTAAVFLFLFPMVASGWNPYGYPPPAGYGTPWTGANPYSGSAATPARPRLRVERSADADTYRLTIRVSGIDPEGVTVATVGGRWLVVGTDESSESSVENRTEDRSGYSRSFSYSSNRLSRRISLPRDADAASMQREDLEDRVEIAIPRVRR